MTITDRCLRRLAAAVLTVLTVTASGHGPAAAAPSDPYKGLAGGACGD